ncbi:FAD-dependent oxidoreductase [Nonomuraea sp. PA05]|uniref:FAD-dependent oxidoreductase n=1 Tax=Nonomuraea sp. PA05 TaxID=2604466 RepID=UPI0011DB9DEA|nr:FAD-dependent oxidoreductase [Nonomuraea sp. PA05]TYB50766.1 FAD-dependent oxidoreductase [Nonomuraea sp. PA05]
MARRVCIIGGGISGLGAAWALARHQETFDCHLYEKADRLGGNAVTVDFPAASGGTVPADISVTAFIPSVYPNYIELMAACGVTPVDTRFSLAVQYGGDEYAHDTASPLRHRLRGDFRRFRLLMALLSRVNELNRRPSIPAALANPFNYVSMRRMLDLYRISDEFRYKVLKPLFVNLVLASGVFDLPASLFSRFLDFFDVEHATPMVTWQGGTRAIYDRMAETLGGRVHLGRAAVRVRRDRRGVTVIDDAGRAERFDDVVLACHADQALALLAGPSVRERLVLGAMRYDDSMYGRGVAHTDGSVLPEDAQDRSTFVRHRDGGLPDDYEITYAMHNQQAWAREAGVPCLVTYNPRHPIDESKVVRQVGFRHVVHDVFHTTALLGALPLLQGRRHTWFCGAHTTVNSQEHAFLSGLAVARRLGADYPFPHNAEALAWFNFHGTLMHGRRFPRAVPVTAA